MTISYQAWTGPLFLDARGRWCRRLTHHAGHISELDNHRPDAHTQHLPEGFALPGFIDNHAHLSRLWQRPDSMPIDAAWSLQHLCEVLQQRAATTPHGTWLLGHGWRFGPREDFARARQRLSEAVPNHPVCLKRVDEHAFLVNDLALSLADLNDNTPDPPGGHLQRTHHGALNGVLVDNAMAVVEAHIPPRSDAELADVVREECQIFLSTGVTCVHEMAVDARLRRALLTLDEQAALPLRVRGFLLTSDPNITPFLEGLADPPGPQRLRWRGLKIFADGALGSRGARLSKPYDDGSRGVSPDSLEQLSRAIAYARRGGWQMAVHAIGDAAVHDAVVALSEGQPSTDARWRIEHVQVLHPHDLERMQRARLVGTVQPLHAIADGAWAWSLLGPRLGPWSYPWARLHRAGVAVGLGTDHPIEHADVPATLAAACYRLDLEGRPLPGASERLSRALALDLHWRGAAYTAFDERWLGRLTPGARCDFAVWDTDLTSCSPHALRQARCLATVVDGQLVWSRD